MRGLIAAALLIALTGCKDDKTPKREATPAPAATGSGASNPSAAASGETAKVTSQPDLDRLCAQAREILATPQSERSARWSKAVHEINDAQIKKGFEAIGGIQGADQIELAKQIAKEAGVPDWQCPDFEKLAVSM